MASLIDKKISQKKAIANGDIEHKMLLYKGFWQLFFLNPLTYVISGGSLLICLCLGVYYDWNIKLIISNSFGYVLTSLITGLVQHFITQKQREK